jgi:integrase
MAKKRGNNEGSISHRKDGRWEARYTIHTVEGPKRKVLYGKTRAEVSTKLTKAMADRDGGIVFDSGGTTVGDYLDRWLSDSVRGTVRESTYSRDKYLVTNHIKPALGRLKLTNLNALHLQGFYRDRLDSGLSGSTVQKMHHVLHKALGQAVRWDLIPRNPADAVKAPSPSSKEMHPLDAEQAKALLEAARGDRLEALYVLALHTGMRIGELLALKWADTDLDAATVRVRRTLTRGEDGRGFVVGAATKSGKGRRVRLTPRAVEDLKRHRAHQAEEKLKAGRLYRDKDLVFAGGGGNPINPSNLRNRSFKPLLERAGLPRITFHDLRHTCASLLFQRNVHPKHVQELLGHASVAITLDTYSHMLPGMGSEAADAIGEALG